jgi:sec-independent protein translocase protein TatB
VFGLSFGELVILGIVALVVVGPRRLPSMLRTAGQLIGKVRRMAMDIRAESGIDEILDAEGIRSEIDNFRRLAAGDIPLDETPRTLLPDREREYPSVGCDAYGALSEDIVPYSPPPAVEAALARAEENGSAPSAVTADENGEAQSAESGGDNLAAPAPKPGENLAPPAVNGEALAPTGAEVKS